MLWGWRSRSISGFRSLFLTSATEINVDLLAANWNDDDGQINFKEIADSGVCMPENLFQLFSCKSLIFGRNQTMNEIFGIGIAN